MSDEDEQRGLGGLPSPQRVVGGIIRFGISRTVEVAEGTANVLRTLTGDQPKEPPPPPPPPARPPRPPRPEPAVRKPEPARHAEPAKKPPAAAAKKPEPKPAEEAHEPAKPVMPRPKPAPEGPRSSLQRMFDELLFESADIEHHDQSHPAYTRLMEELSPDEARILRLFARSGPQAALDVRTAGTFGFGSTLIAPGITMIGRYAGCQEIDRVPAYLDNLNRLGLIWFSREMIGDVNAYQLLEAQPEVLELAHAQRTRTVLRSIELTAFGRNLCAEVGLMERSAATGVSDGEDEHRTPHADAR